MLKIEVVKFVAQDIITTSTPTPDPVPVTDEEDIKDIIGEINPGDSSNIIAEQ